MTQTDDIPEGFTLLDPLGPFHELVGPLYGMERDDRIVVGMRVDEKHRNKGSYMHGGMFLMLADTSMTLAGIARRPADKGIVTASLTSDFIGPAAPGDWIEAETEVIRAGKSVLFMAGLVRQGGTSGKILMRYSATFQVVPTIR